MRPEEKLLRKPMRKSVQGKNKRGKVRAQVSQRIVRGTKIIDKELAHGFYLEEEELYVLTR